MKDLVLFGGAAPRQRGCRRVRWKSPGREGEGRAWRVTASALGALTHYLLRVGLEAYFQDPSQLYLSGTPSVSSHQGVISWDGLRVRMRGLLWAKKMAKEEV